MLLACAALFLPARIPLEHVGFLSDDYYAGEHIALHAYEHPSAPDYIATTFARRWIKNLEWYRPLTILSCAADFTMFGTDGRRHHIQNLIFWCLAAVTAGLLYPCFSGSRRCFSVPVALLLLYPGAAETFGWLVGREDLFFTIFACLAFRARLRRPDSIWAPLPWVALALLCKETAVVIAPLLNWVGAWVPRTTPRTKGAWTAIAREIAPWLVVAAWFGVRYALFGNLGMSYRNASFFSYADPVKMLVNVAESLVQLVAPVNVPQAAAFGFRAWPIRLGFIALSAAILVAGFKYHRRAGDWRRIMALLAVIGAPILLVSPLYGVGESLEQGRALALPGAAWVIILGLAVHRALAGKWTRVIAITSFLGLIPISMISLFIALAPYAGATKIAEDMLGDIAKTGIPPGSDALMTRIETTPGEWRHELIVHNGVYVLSSSIYSAVRPPFWPEPGLRLRHVSQWPLPHAPQVHSERELALEAPASASRPWIIAFRKTGAPVTDPWFSAVAQGGHVGPIPEAMTPPHGAKVPVAGLSSFEVRLPPSVWSALDSVEVRVRGPGGERLADHKIDGPPLRQAVSPEGLLRVAPATTAEIQARLVAAATDVAIWWVEGSSGGKPVLRTPWQAVAVVAP